MKTKTREDVIFEMHGLEINSQFKLFYQGSRNIC